MTAGEMKRIPTTNAVQRPVVDQWGSYRFVEFCVVEFCVVELCVVELCEFVIWLLLSTGEAIPFDPAASIDRTDDHSNDRE
jgi:hypothetical protein